MALRKRVKIRLRIAVEGRRSVPLFGATSFAHYPLLRVLTDRGSEYCGNREHHEYALYLELEDIAHTRTKARSPQTNGICERFNMMCRDEFYSVAFRRKVYRSVEEIQLDLDAFGQVLLRQDADANVRGFDSAGQGEAFWARRI